MTDLLSFVCNLVVSKSPNVAMNEDLCFPSAVAVGPGGSIYVADTGNNRVVELSSNGDFIRAFGEGLLHGPEGIAVNRFGRIFVADTLNHQVVLFDENGKELFTFKYDHDGISLFSYPRGICFLNDEKGFLVADTGNDQIVQILLEGDKLLFSKIKLLKTSPCGIALTSDSQLVVSDFHRNAVKFFKKKDGSDNYEMDKKVEIKNPFHLCVDNSGSVWVASWGDRRLPFITPSGKVGTQNKSFDRAKGICLNPEKNKLFVCEAGAKKITEIELN